MIRRVDGLKHSDVEKICLNENSPLFLGLYSGLNCCGCGGGRMTQSLLSIRGLEVRYNHSIEALKNIDFDLHHGEFTILLGSSGAGKSTLLRAINFLVPHFAGEIVSSSLGVIDPKQASLLRAFRRDIAMVFQQHQLIDRLSALDNVLVGRLGFHPSIRSLFPLPKVDQDWALSCLDRVGLQDKALEKVRNLSGGQQQRVGIPGPGTGTKSHLG